MELTENKGKIKVTITDKKLIKISMSRRVVLLHSF